jgi:hypothetical protein
MYHHASMAAVEVEWTFVSVKRPCAICTGHDGCRRGFDDEFACCIRVSSEWPLAGGGWVHRVRHLSRAARGATPPPAPEVVATTSPPTSSIVSSAMTSSAMIAA